MTIADNQIRVPDDVLYRTIAALFGFFGLDMPPSTPGDREEARQLIRKARKARRAFQIADGRGDTLSDPGSDEETYMEVDTRDPYYIPKPIIRGTRRDCFVYVRCLAYHHVLDNLAKNVGRWAGKQAEAANQALGIEKGESGSDLSAGADCRRIETGRRLLETPSSTPKRWKPRLGRGLFTRRIRQQRP
jgi:hypothetical protein